MRQNPLFSGREIIFIIIVYSLINDFFSLAKQELLTTKNISFIGTSDNVERSQCGWSSYTPALPNNSYAFGLGADEEMRVSCF